MLMNCGAYILMKIKKILGHGTVEAFIVAEDILRVPFSNRYFPQGVASQGDSSNLAADFVVRR